MRPPLAVRAGVPLPIYVYTGQGVASYLADSLYLAADLDTYKWELGPTNGQGSTCNFCFNLGT